MSNKTSKKVYLLIVLTLLISIAIDVKADFTFLRRMDFPGYE